jgi:hypothetical protein
MDPGDTMVIARPCANGFHYRLDWCTDTDDPRVLRRAIPIARGLRQSLAILLTLRYFLRRLTLPEVEALRDALESRRQRQGQQRIR